MAADFDDDDAAASSYKGKQRFSRKGTLLLPPEEVRHLFHRNSLCSERIADKTERLKI